MDEENATLEEPLNKNFREPKIRFSEFQDSWNYKRLSDFTSRLNRKNKNNQSDLVLTISAQYGLIDQKEFFNKNVSGSNIENYYLLKNGDFAYNRSYSNDYPYGAIKRLDNYECGVVSTLYIVFEPKSNVNSNYLKYYFETDKWNAQISLISGEGARNHGLLNLSPSDFFQTKHWIPSLDEQSEISVFLEKIFILESLLEQKLLTLKKYKEGTISFFIDSIDTHNIMTLDKLCSITTGKLDANAMNENGTYKFFTCSKQDYLINTYAFDAEALLISGNGDVGLCKYYKGKFNAYQRTYVLTDFKINPIYIKCCFEKQINTIVRSETNKGAMPYIRREMFSKIKIPIPETNKINECTRISSCFEDLISITERKISILEQLKNFLNKNMFI